MRQLWIGVLAASAILGTDAGAADWHRLREGDPVEVECIWTQRGAVAEEVDVRTSPAGGKVEIVAPLESLSDDGLRTLATDLPLSRETRFKSQDGEPITRAELQAGDWVEVDGRVEAGVLTVSRVKRRDDNPGKIEIEGPIQSMDREAGIVSVAGIPVSMRPDVVVRGLPVYVPRAIDDDEIESTFLAAFDGRLLLGGQLSGAVEPEENFNLNKRRLGDQVRSDWSTEMQIDVRFHETFDAFAKAGFSGRRILKDEEGDETDRTDRRLQQAWMLWRPARPIAIQIGRQDFDEPREWLYDETLDAVRVHAQWGQVRTEASLSTRWNTTSSRLEDWTNWMLVSRREVASRWDAEVYAIHRRLTTTSDRPVWVGVRSRGRLRSSIRHWLELSSLSGTHDGVDRRAWAIDAGLRVRLERRTRWSIVGGWAVGSGGSGPSGIYRQTGLQDNNDKFSGVSSFKYYGELLEPELSNLAVLTAGTGLRPTRHASVDVVFHDYRQRRAAPRLEGSNLETRPRGDSPEIGREWDLIVALEEIPRLDIEYVFAWFDPGAAFDVNAESATFHQLSVRYAF